MSDALLAQVRGRLTGAAVALIEPAAVKRLLEQKRPDQALAAARKACAGRAGDPAYAYWVGVAAAFAGRAAEAAPWLEAAIAANPRDARAHAALAYVSRPLGRLGARVAHYRRAIELSPRDPVLRTNCSEALLDVGDAESAEREARAALALAPEHPLSVGALARAAQARGRSDEAIALLQAALRKSPGERDLRWWLAHACLRAGRRRATARSATWRSRG